MTARKELSRGSSPRMRGARTIPPLPSGTPRFIPAHAGSTITAAASSGGTTVHPRACGEHRYRPGYETRVIGSSPRMRGAPGGRQGNNGCQRFIPAHAGSTRYFCAREINLSVHPRACGEHTNRPITGYASTGSSPRMRGAPVKPCSAASASGFIPAHAGSTKGACFTRFSFSVHPRACGEHINRSAVDGSEYGSSPRMRGARILLASNGKCKRFIPAHAGSTQSGALHQPHQPVHPRACGEHNAVLGIR